MSFFSYHYLILEDSMELFSQGNNFLIASEWHKENEDWKKSNSNNKLKTEKRMKYWVKYFKGLKISMLPH